MKEYSTQALTKKLRDYSSVRSGEIAELTYQAALRLEAYLSEVAKLKKRIAEMETEEDDGK